MGMFDKRMGKEKIESLEFAEDSRETDWIHPSFVARLFQGSVEWNLIHPFPAQAPEDKKIGDEFLGKLEAFLVENHDADEIDKTGEIPQKVMKGLADLGVFAMKIPQKYDGLGLSQINYNRALHLIASHCGATTALASAHQSIGVPQPLLLCGTEEQRAKFLPMFRKGAISAFALTEVGAGSDPRTMVTTATPTEDGKHFLINGTKLWCTNGTIADIIIVMAVTPPKMVNGKERKQITAFIVETKSKGFHVDYRCDFMGLKAIQNGVLRFDNVKVPAENIVMGEGEGLKLALMTLNAGRLGIPAAVAGGNKWCMAVTREWAKERVQWGGPIGEHESIASKISKMSATSFSMEAMTKACSAMVDAKHFDIRLEAAMAKLYCTEENYDTIDDTLQIRGGRGYETAHSLKGRGEKGYAVERNLRDCRINMIFEGSSEIMHLFIAREALDFHFQKIMPLMTGKVPLAKLPFAGLKLLISYALWYPKLWLPTIGTKYLGMKSPMKRHMCYIDRTAKRLARKLFHQMMIHQKKMATKQMLINRFVDIGMYLFAMSCSCALADHLAKTDPEKKNALDLADYFCRMKKREIKKLFKDIKCNDDKASNKIAKSFLNDDYEWFEFDIIKPRG